MPGSVDWRDRLRASGHRLTAQREQVLAAVEALGHATPDEIHAYVQDAGINLSTVYRTLELLDELGLIRHAHISDRAPTYHSVTDHEHFHLVCRGCRQVISVPENRLRGLSEQVRTEHGFSVDTAHLTVFGLCGSCQE